MMPRHRPGHIPSVNFSGAFSDEFGRRSTMITINLFTGLSVVFNRDTYSLVFTFAIFRINPFFRLGNHKKSS